MRLGVSNAPYITSASSTALSSKILYFASDTSYAAIRPPKYRIVVSKSGMSERGVVVKSIVSTNFTASSNSVFKPIIHRVSNPSTSVAPQALKGSPFLPETGLTSSCPHAFSRYPLHACSAAALITAKRSLSAPLFVELVNLCCTFGIALGLLVGNWIVEVIGKCSGCFDQ